MVEYERINWQDFPSEETPINAENLNKMDEALGEIAEYFPVLEETVGELVAQKANIDGYYQTLGVGTADQLTSSMYVEDKEPYTFRTAGGSKDIGNRAYLDAVVGGSIVWNQMIKNGNFANGTAEWTSPQGTLTATNNELEVRINSDWNNDARQLISFKNYHKYLISFQAKADSTLSDADWILSFVPVGLSTISDENYIETDALTTSYKWFTGCIVGSDQTESVRVTHKYSGTNYVGASYYIKNVNVFDITQMFGSAVADQIYAMEAANAGAGVAWFKALFPKSYYPYNAGELMSVSDLESRDTVGFNQWDEEYVIYNNSQLLSKNHIPAFPNTDYHFKSSSWAAITFYDADKVQIDRLVNYSTDHTFTTPSGTAFLSFAENADYGTTYKGDICINLSWSGYRNGEYQPYEKYSYPLDSSLTLRGVPKVDGSGNIYYDGDTYEPDGTVTRRYGIVDLGTLTWQNSSNGWTQTSTLPENIAGSPNNEIANIITSSLMADSANNVYNHLNDNTICAGEGAVPQIYSSAFVNKTGAQIKELLSGVYLVYKLATPTTEEAEPYNPIQIVDDFGTEEFVTDSIVPVGTNTRYPANLRDKLQHQPDLAESDGQYVITQSGSQLSLTPITETKELPNIPTTDGSYRLKVTVSSGTPTLSWEVVS